MLYSAWIQIWGIDMHSDVERPYPVDYTHPTGEQAKIDFIWGDPKSMTPIGIIILIRYGESYVKLGEATGKWPTFGEANVRGIELAFQLVSLYVGLSGVLGRGVARKWRDSLKWKRSGAQHNR